MHRGDLNRAIRHLGIAALELDVLERRAVGELNGERGRNMMTLDKFHAMVLAASHTREAFARLKGMRDELWGEPPHNPVMYNGERVGEA